LCHDFKHLVGMAEVESEAVENLFAKC